MTANADVQVTELGAEDHACLTFGESEELFDLTAAFVRDGLSAGLKVVRSPMTPAPGLAAGGARPPGAGGAAPARGQMIAAGWEGTAARRTGILRQRGGCRLAGGRAWSPAGRQGLPGLRRST